MPGSGKSLAGGSGTAGAPTGGSPVSRPADSGDHSGPATLALTALTLVTAVGMGRLFRDGSYLVPVVVAAVVAHGVSWGGRRLGLPLWLSALATWGALGLSTAWLALPEATVYGLPSLATLDLALDELSAAATLFDEVVAPAPVTKGFLVASMAGVGMVGFLADWGAFRVRAHWEPVLPAFALFLLTALLGTAESRVLFVGLFLGALVAFVLVQEAAVTTRRGSWFTSRSPRGPAWWWQTGAGLGSVAVVVGLIAGPLLPAGDGDGRGGSRAGRGGVRRVTVSPLVDIRGRLVDRSSAEAFTVRSSQRAYWRLTSLDSFDGDIWSSDRSYPSVKERLPGGVGNRARGDHVVQSFEIRSLSSIWLPAAYRPVRVDGAGDVGYNADLGTLVTGRDTSDGLSYRVESVVPRPTAGELDHVGAGSPGADGARFLGLPELSPRLKGLALQVAATAQHPSPFAKALALQDFFQRGFTYDLQARAGHDVDALEQFLFRTRRGYCEQFAGAYAVMARAVGLPSRVAVGFTPGELGPDGRYHVRALHAHAWPEVLLGGYGWVAFEPTPGRGAPGASYTGLPEAQARLEEPSTATTAPHASLQDEPATTTVPGAGDHPPPRPPESDPSSAPPYRRILLGALVLALPGAVPLAKRIHRSRRRRLATEPRARVMVAWYEAAEALALAGISRQPPETLTEYAERAAPAAIGDPQAPACLTALARHTAAATYGQGPLPPEVVPQAIFASATVTAAVQSSTPAPRRLLHALDPLPLLHGHRVPNPPQVQQRPTGVSRASSAGRPEHD